MENVKIAFQPMPDDERPPNGYQYVNCHKVYGIKIEYFWRKACLVAGGYITHTQDVIT